MFRKSFGFKMKKFGAVMLAVICLLTTAGVSNVSAATLTDAQKQICYDCGYPTSRSAYLNAYYTDYVDNVGALGSFTALGSFYIFIGHMAEASSSDGLADFSIATRGLYSEVSGHTGYYQTELEHINDSLVNRVFSNDSNWGTYLEAAQYQGMNAINEEHSQFWTGNPVKMPLYDSAWLQEARIGLMTAYCMAWTACGVDDTPAYPRYSDLEVGKYFFNETYVAGYHNAGHFYFH